MPALWLKVSNTLAYLCQVYLTELKSFITLGLDWSAEGTSYSSPIPDFVADLWTVWRNSPQDDGRWSYHCGNQVSTLFKKLPPQFRSVRNYLECFPGRSFHPSLMFSSKVRAYLRVEFLSGSHLCGNLLALPTNIRLDWKSLPGTSTLAY